VKDDDENNPDLRAAMRERKRQRMVE